MLLLLHSAFILSVVKMLLKGKVGCHVLNSHGNCIFDREKSWNCIFEFLWEPCSKKSEPTCKLINRIPGSCLLISSLSGTSSRMDVK